jgi:hypothetical protein
VTTGNCLLERSGGHPLRLAATDSLVIATLPDVIVLRLGKERLLDRMPMLVRAIHDELKGGRLGGLAVATDLASALFVQMLRVHCEPASNAGALRLLSSFRMLGLELHILQVSVEADIEPAFARALCGPHPQG